MIYDFALNFAKKSVDCAIGAQNFVLIRTKSDKSETLNSLVTSFYTRNLQLNVFLFVSYNYN